MLAGCDGAARCRRAARVRIHLPGDRAMRCSLLTLSSYVDHELPPEQSGELEAHLIACVRCSTALGYLREEAERIHSLAAAHASPGAADRLLIEVGLAAPVRAEDPPFVSSAEPSFEFSLDLRARAQRP